MAKDPLGGSLGLFLWVGCGPEEVHSNDLRGYFATLDGVLHMLGILWQIADAHFCKIFGSIFGVKILETQ